MATLTTLLTLESTDVSSDNLDLSNDGNIPVNSGSFGFNVVPQTLHRYMFQNK